MLDYLKRRAPFIEWMGNYETGHLKGDLAAGLTTAVMLIPQGMAYAMLAGLPPVVGLYASIIPLVLYALFGSSRHLAVGPVAMVSLLVASGVGALAEQGTEQYILLAVTLALMVGAFQLVMGLGKFGFLTNFLSHPVLSGFTSAAALIIGFSQLKHLLGVNIPRSHHIHKILMSAAEQVGAIEPLTVGIGVVSIAALVGLKAWKPMFPRALVVVVGATLAVWGFGLHESGVAIVGAVPAGLPSPSVPALSMANMLDLLPIAITISLVAFMESISVAKAFARRDKYDVDANQELIGLGLANFGSAFFGGYPVTGGFSRTAVNAQAGAGTPMAAMITAGVVAVALLFLTPLLHFLPKAVLAAIIMTAVFGLVDVKEVSHLWKVKRADLAVLVITFVATLAFGIEQGILTGAAASLFWFVYRTTRPHTAVLGRVPGTSDFRNIANHPDVELTPGVLTLRIDAQYYFGNVDFLRKLIRRLRDESPEPIHAIVIDACSMNQLDSSADSALHEIAEDLGQCDIKFAFASVKRPVMDVMTRSGLDQLIGAERFFANVGEAVEALSTPPSRPSTIVELKAADGDRLGTTRRKVCLH